MKAWLLDFWRYWNIEYHAQCPLNCHDFGIVSMTSHGRRIASHHRLLDHTTVPLWSEAIVVFQLQWANNAKNVSLSWLPHDCVIIMIMEIWHMAQCVFELIIYPYSIFEPLFTKRMDVLPQDVVKSRRREIRVWNFPIALKIDRHLGSCIAELPVILKT